MVRVAGVAGAVVLGLAAVVLSVVLGPPRFARDSLLDRFRPAGDADSSPEPLQAVGDGTVPPAELDGPVLGVPVEVLLAVLVTTVAAALLVRALLRARDEPRAVDDPDPDLLEEPPGGPGVDVTEVRAAVRDAVTGLDAVTGRDAADVVVACWVRLEAAGGAAGSRRRPSDTATDFAQRLQDAVPGLDPVALGRLRSVYSRVRFGRAGASAADVDVARAALADLTATLDPVARDGSQA